MIEVNGLGKSFKVRRAGKVTSVDAVRGVDFAVARGEIFGFLGPNGAGKTTTLQMLATLIRPDKGSATIAGADLLAAPAEVRKRIGFVAQGSGTNGDSTARIDLVFQARMYGSSKVAAMALADAVIANFQLDSFADRKISTYSGGQRRRLDVALGVIHSPQVLVLDEPTAGLDPQSRARMWQEVRRLRDAGMTVFLTTHYLDEADALSDRIMIIDQGRIIASDTAENLKAAVSGDQVDLEVAEPLRVSDAATALKSIADLVEVDGQHVRGRVPRAGRAVPGLLRDLDRTGIALDSIEVHRPTLDDVFLTLTGRSLRDAEAGQPEQPVLEGADT
jgi:ABC-2 type transport system ATP-binding protein